MKQAIRYLDYVCAPSGIKIEANYPLGSQYLNIEIAYGNKRGFNGQYKIRLPYNREVIDDRVAVFCNAMLMFTEEEINDYVEEDSFMPALYVFRNLKEVRTKSGNLVWKRP